MDQDLVRDVPKERGCPPRCVALLQSLGAGLMSRVMANGGASTWIPRGRGVLQGSPLSPLLWNVVADGLIRDLNDGTEGLPRAVFYADDGALLYREEAEIEPLLELVGRWCKRNGIEVNAAKCGHVTLRPDPGPVCWGTELIPQVQEYRYLGFPVTAKGIDFQDHLGRRLEQAKANARFMAQHSATWGGGESAPHLSAVPRTDSRVWRTVGVGGHSARQAAVDANGCRMAPAYPVDCRGRSRLAGEPEPARHPEPV